MHRFNITIHDSVSPVCEDDTTLFSNSSLDGSAPIVNYSWNMGGAGNYVNGTSNSPNPQYVYTNCGTYTVTLSVTDTNGCTHDTTISVTVHCPPVVDFTSSIVCENDFTVFTPSVDTLITGNSIVNWNWSFGSNLPNDSFNFDTCGINVLDVTLTVIDNQLPGCTSSVTNPISINCNPVADFDWTDTCQGNYTIFTNQSTNGGTGPIITQWNWTHSGGDYSINTNSSATNPLYLYDTCGTNYLTTLVVTDNYGCTDSTSQYIEVQCNPIAIIDSVSPVCEDDTTLFSNSSLDGSAPIVNYSWNMGGAGNYANGTSSNSPEPQYVYTNCGTYTVTLSVTDTNGCTHDTTISVTVHCPPVVDFTSSIVCENDFTVFTPSVDTLITGNSIVNWNWSFGSNLANDSFNFDTCGNNVLDVTLTVIDNQLPGCTSSVTNPISINCNPVANFDWSKECQGDYTTFTNQSTNGGTGPIITQWNWTHSGGSYVLIQIVLQQILYIYTILVERII